MLATETICENYLFRRLYRSGKSAAAPLVVVYYRRNGTKRNRMGITTSKTVGNAVRRSRCRRVLREAYRLLEPEMKTGYDLILVARTRTSQVKMNAVKDQLYGIYCREGLRKE